MSIDGQFCVAVAYGVEVVQSQSDAWSTVRSLGS